MALAITLKPQERMILAGVVVRNTSPRSAHLLVETPAPVLRQGDILSEKAAQTPCGRIYFTVQLLYLEANEPEPLRALLLHLAQDVLTAAPSLGPLVEEITMNVASGDYYKALRAGKLLLKREQELLAHATPNPAPPI